MRAFISYSLNDQDQYILSLLSKELRKRNFALSQSSDFNSDMSSLTKASITKSQLFIGIVTDQSEERSRVFNEWKLAKSEEIPAILMVEETVNIDDGNDFPIIRFDRHNPNKAIKELNRKTEKLKKTKNDDSAMWAIVAAVAVLAIIVAVLSSSNNKK